MRFSKLLDVEDVSLLLAQFLGRSALRRFRPAWPSAHRWVRQVLPRMVHGGAVYAPRHGKVVKRGVEAKNHLFYPILSYLMLFIKDINGQAIEKPCIFNIFSTSTLGFRRVEP